MRLFHPLDFMLASPVESAEEALERFSPVASPVEAQIEDKYDGVRAQIHWAIRSSLAAWPCFRDPARI